MQYQYILPLLSVLLGYLIAIVLKPKDKKNIKLLLAFSGSFLLSITLMHLLPEVYDFAMHNHDDHHGHDHSAGYRIGLFIMLGILLQIFLEFFSKGAEHGHVHKDDDFKSIPWTLFISLCLHALLEGLPISHHHELALGIAIHHLPIAIILTTFFSNTNMNKKTIFVFMLLFAFMTPLGTYASEYLLFLEDYYAEISAIVVGILFHIASTIIYETNENHKFNIQKISAIILGIILAYFT
ncbi:MAG: ZIP family metal transporter [Bacteroidota bacterium]|nr:ZIP family metal transporter [Bacteroidota bacterium]